MRMTMFIGFLVSVFAGMLACEGQGPASPTNSKAAPATQPFAQQDETAVTESDEMEILAVGPKMDAAVLGAARELGMTECKILAFFVGPTIYVKQDKALGMLPIDAEGKLKSQWVRRYGGDLMLLWFPVHKKANKSVEGTFVAALCR